MDDTLVAAMADLVAEPDELENARRAEGRM